jgi:hypothetical protein
MDTLREQANIIRAEITFALGVEPETLLTVDGAWQATIPCDDDSAFFQLRLHGFSGVRAYRLSENMTKVTFTNWPDMGGAE